MAEPGGDSSAMKKCGSRIADRGILSIARGTGSGDSNRPRPRARRRPRLGMK